MAKRSNVPKFGNWESEDVPYTAYFDKAREARTGTKMINPNDPEENIDLSIDSEDQQVKESVKSANELHKIKEDGHYNAGNKSADNQRKPSRQTIGSEYNIERSPLHRQAKTPGRDSPLSEGKNSYDSSHGTPGRSRLKPVNRGDETPDKVAAVPKFGEWDVNNPASADEFTRIFDEVREEKQGGAGNNPDRPHAIRPKQHTDDKSQCFCFAWCKK